MKRRQPILTTGARAACLALIVAVVVLGHAGPTEAPTVKITPITVHLTAPDASDRAADLFDRDTITSLEIEGSARIEVTLEAPVEVRSVKIHGRGWGTLTVAAQTAEGWQALIGPAPVVLGDASGPAWTTLTAAAPVSTDRLQVDFSGGGGGSIADLRELEIWGAGARTPIRSGDEMDAAISGPTPPAHGRRYDATPPAGSIGALIDEAPDDPADNTFRVSLDRDPRDFKRAWLVYEAVGLGHWVAAARSLNGHAALGGVPLTPGTDWSRQIEEVDPDWLDAGDNRLEFRVPEGAGSRFSVRNVRVVAEMEDGSNFVKDVAVGRSMRIRTQESTGHLGMDANASSKLEPSRVTNKVSLTFDKPTQVEALAFNVVGHVLGNVTLTWLANGSWSNPGPTLSGQNVAIGSREVAAPSNVAVEGVRLSFDSASGTTVPIADVVPIGSGAGPRVTPPRLHVTYPDAGQFRSREAYIRGFLQPWDNGSGPARITIGPVTVDQEDGGFEALVTKEDLGLASQDDASPWSVDVRAEYPDGQIVTLQVLLDHPIAPPESTDGFLLPTRSFEVNPGLARTLEHDGAGLRLGPDAVETGTTLKITPLSAADLAALDQGMVNVTRGPRRGYRFQPHGMKFRTAIEVSVPYSKALIPPGLSENDIRTFYFDDQAGRWKALDRLTVDTSTMKVVSLTDHFTDIINATVAVPDHPQPLSYSPTQMKDLKAADPGAGIQLIEPPRPTSQGDARLSYPLDLPSGRAGIEPRLEITYDSSHANGWMGVGWNLRVPAVSIDARWGVPYYDAGLETESYVLEAEMLTPVAHRGALTARVADRMYHTRVEGSFRRIVRHGSQPSGYWWEATDKSGTRFIYGGDPALDAPSADAILADPGASAHINQWMLREVRDTRGNSMRYHYDVVDGGGGAAEPWRQIYLRSIRYTGSDADEGPYEIVFNRAAGRTDVMVDGRPGFKTVLMDRLASIEVRLIGDANPLIRRYVFDYGSGPFGKTLLTRVTAYGEDGVTEFNHHSFEYFDEVGAETPDAINGFRGSVSFGGATTVSGDALLLDKTSSAFSADQAASAQLHFYGGIATGNQKEVSAGFKVGGEAESGFSKMTLIDLNGDGTPDQVFQDGSHFSFRPNLGGPIASPSFGSEVDLPSLSDIGHQNSQTITLGAQGFARGINGLADVSYTWSDGTSYMSDVNGDGLPDVIVGSTVFFNALVGSVPTFSPASPIPLEAGAPSDASGMVLNPEAGKADMEKAFPLIDSLRRWKAPYSGTVAITGQVRLESAPPPGYTTADGVRVSIQRDGTEIWSMTIADPTDLAPRTIDGLGSVPVAAGDDLYFRVHSIGDGSYDAVVFDPAITYTGGVPAVVDENGMSIRVYRASSDYSYGGRALPWVAPFNGTANLSGDLIKPSATTDDVAVEIAQNGVVVFRSTIGRTQTGVFPFSFDLTTVAQETIQVRLDADSRIDLSDIRFAPILTFQTIEGNPAPKDASGRSLLFFHPPVAAQVYPRNASTSPYVPIVAPEEGDICVRQKVTLLGTPPADFETNVTLAVKRPGVRLAKRRIEVRGGAIIGSDTLQAVFHVEEGDRLYFTADATHPDALTHLSVGPPNVIYLPGACGTGGLAPFDVHLGIANDEAFGGGFRRWSFGQYNGRDGAAAVVESRLRLPANDADTITKDFLQMVPFPHDDVWRAEDQDCRVAAGGMSASRLMIKHLAFPDGSSYGGGRGVQRAGGAINTCAGVSTLGFGVGVSHGNNWSAVDFFDFNGDRYPDVVGGGAVQATLPNGALGATRFDVGGFGHVRDSTSDSLNVNLGATTSTQRSNAEGRLQSISTEQSGYNLNVGVVGSRGSFETDSDLIDINGDGLPDYVRKSGGGLLVRLNLGYRFGAEENWGGSSTLRFEKSQSHGISAGVGATLPAYSYGGGFADTVSDAAAEQDLVDMNGDGLVDIVRKPVDDDVVSTGTDLLVRFNTGDGFTAERTFRGALSQPAHGNQRVSRNLGLHFTIPIPIPFSPISIILNPGFYGGENLGGAEVVLSDFDGDGYADHVYSDTDGNVQARLNGHGRTHLLKRVTRPLGAVIDLDYARSGNTTEQPGNRWVLSRTSVFDGYAGDGVDRQLTTLLYEGGRYDRGEREFYGFRTVTEEIRNPAQADALYRSIVRTYANDTYYGKGLLMRELTRDEAGRPFQETVNTYDEVPVTDGAVVTGLEDFTATRFPALSRVDRLFYEGQALPAKSATTRYEYDALGNVVRFTDDGDPGAQDDLEARITYFHDDPSYIVGKADGIIVSGNGVVMRQRSAVLQSGTGNLLQVRQRLGNGQEAVTDLVYFANGNLQSVVGPANLHGQRLALRFEYDTLLNTHVTAIEDSFGYRSTATFNPKFGQVDTSTDINGQPTRRLYDGFGRLAAVFGPYELGGGAPTLGFDYHPDAAVPYAVTRHIDTFRDPGDFIETIQFSDGLKRALQTKQDASLHAGAADPNPPQVMIVSGRMNFDQVGRSIEHFYPVVEPKGPGNSVFNASYDGIAPTRTQFDVLDRTTRVTIPDGSLTTTTYGFGPDRGGAMQFVETFTDANGVPRKNFRNVRDLITEIREFNKAGTQTISTSFEHDALKQLVRVVDDRGNQTRQTWDNLGRRTVLDSPDAGRTEFRYDLASNAIAKITANLRAAGLQIDYDFEFNRLKSIAYPQFPGNNVAYTYGDPGASENSANRLATVSDESGFEERFYGRLGEIVREIRTIASDTQGSGPGSPEVYTTSYVYDTWGRLQRMTYPDTEVVTYSYDAGGKVRAVTGVKAGTTYTYVGRLEYDKFEDRAFSLYGNGTRTTYTHDARNRRLAALQSLTGGGVPFQNLAYDYDRQGNVLAIANVVPVPPAADFGGPTAQSFTYDDLNRLTGASGTWRFAPTKTRVYGLQVEYDSIHNMVSKRQSDAIVQPSGAAVPQQKTSFDFAYQYGPDGGARPHAPLHVGDRTYAYDADGNQTGWANDRNGTRRSIVWDEDNRIQSITDNGHVQTYKYDDAGRRVIKRGPQGETVYVNQYFTVRNRSVATKHLFVGPARMASKLVYQENHSGAGSPTSPPIEKDVYFYHPDQVGSSNFVTDAAGGLYEHLEYIPFGEIWVEESTNTQRTPYLFTGKELDEETGLYDFGARYYDPRTSVWQSADPALPDILATRADLQRVPRRLAAYTYALQNPVIRTDPDGRDPIDQQLNDPEAFKLTPTTLLPPRQRGIRFQSPLTLTPPTLTPTLPPVSTVTIPSPTGITNVTPPDGSVLPSQVLGKESLLGGTGTGLLRVPGDSFQAFLDRGVDPGQRETSLVTGIYQERLRLMQQLPDVYDKAPSILRGLIGRDWREKGAASLTSFTIDSTQARDYPNYIERANKSEGAIPTSVNVPLKRF